MNDACRSALLVIYCFVFVIQFFLAINNHHKSSIHIGDSPLQKIHLQYFHLSPSGTSTQATLIRSKWYRKRDIFFPA